ncbi:MAG: alpha/beta fold hydrolase [Spirosomataceae bacterium]
MKKYPWLFSVLFLVWVSCQKDTEPQVLLTPTQTAIAYSINSNVGGYLEALPTSYTAGTEKYPLFLFLHGAGEVGNGTTDIAKVESNGPPALLKKQLFPSSFTVNGKTYSFIVISPQFRSWPTTTDIQAVLDHVLTKYRVDVSRIYVCGLSMGGGLTWDYAATYPNRLAAIVPICGATSPLLPKAQSIAQGKLPVWAFHNQDDSVVPVSNTTEFVAKINSQNPSVAARMTIWPTGDHDAWTKATNPSYKENGLNIYEWCLQYQR